MNIDYRSDNVLELRGPVDLTTGLAVSGATVTAALYDVSKDTSVATLTTRLAEDEIAATTAIRVQNILAFTDTDFVHVELDDGTVHETTINGVPAAGVITLAAGLPSAAAMGKELRRYRLNTLCKHISVENAANWEIGDVFVSPTDTSGTVSTAVVDQVLKLDNVLVIDTAVSAATLTGKEVKARLLASTPISCVSFGIFPTVVNLTVVGDPAWGYRGPLPSTDFDGYDPGVNIGLKLGDRVRTEFTLVKGADVLDRTNIATVMQL